MREFSELLRRFSDYRASAWTLVAANALPLFGVVFFRWDAFAIIALYWIENVIIGVINVLKILTCCPDPAQVQKSATQLGGFFNAHQMRKELKELHANLATAKLAHHGQKLFLVPFFTFHYGMFCMVHGVFLMAFFAGDSFGAGPFALLPAMMGAISSRHLGWAVAALAGSHLYSFFRNYLGRGEYQRTLAVWLMFQPYGRIVLLHVAILFGGFVVVALGSNIGVLVVFVLGKTFVDLAMHLRERERNAAKPQTAPQETVLAEMPVK